MKYAVQVVDNSELPAGIERVIVERAGQAPLLILAESAARTWRFLQRWEESQRDPAEVFELRAV